MTTKKKARKAGRPSRYNEALGNRICERIANGESLRAICEDEGYPHRDTVTRWYLHDQDKKAFSERYYRACDIRAELLMEEILEIADSINLEGTTPGTGEAMARVQAAKLKIESKKWEMAKLSPKRHALKPNVAIANKVSQSATIKAQESRRQGEEEFMKRYAEIADTLKHAVK